MTTLIKKLKSYFTKLVKKLNIRKKSKLTGFRIIRGRPYSQWNRSDNRSIIRLNRICCGVMPFYWDGVPKRIGLVFECKTSLGSFGNIKNQSTFSESLGDLVSYNNLNCK